MNKLTKQEATKIVNWYEEHKRNLPWRDTGNPYHVWISEIMLQQTRIEAVKPKYENFMRVVPDISSLASIDEDALNRLWEGLGYYSRARNLKKCAIELVQTYNSQLPQHYEDLIGLPGIGPYTAGAIASIAYQQPVPAIDGNVLRVFARYFGMTDDIRDSQTRNEIQMRMMDLYQGNPSSFFSSLNQGCMEIGEVICTPNGQPLCDQCPLAKKCVCYKKNLWNEIPYRSALKERRRIDRTLLIIRDGDSFLLHKRDANGLLANLYEFIGVDGHLDKQEVVKLITSYQMNPLRIKVLPKSKHLFSHLEWHMIAYEIQVEQIDTIHLDHVIHANKKKLSSLAIPSAFKTYIDWYALRD